jgi:virulence-associated protein VagC
LKGNRQSNFPPDFCVSTETLTIRKDGDAIILEPIKSTTWPEGFFEGIYVEDPAFARPPQGA